MRPDHQHRGQLRLAAARGQYRAARWLPSEDLADLVLYYWFVRWDRTAAGPFDQEVLTQPYLHAVLERDDRTGRTTSRLVGVNRRRFVRRLTGKGRVAGVAFQPGALSSWVAVPLAHFTDRVVPLGRALGIDARALERAVLAARGERGSVAALERFFRERQGARPPASGAAEARRILARLAQEPAILRVEQLAAASGLGERALQRLFRQHVGASPKWVLRRLRLIEAARRLDAGEALSFPDLAASLGYFDQAHFIRDFRALVGRTPASYARQR